MNSKAFYLNAHKALIDGRWQQQQYLLIAEGVIQQISSKAEEGIPVLELPDGMLLPGFIDTQVNGGGGRARWCIYYGGGTAKSDYCRSSGLGFC